MEAGREAEPHPRLRDAAGDAFGAEVDGDAERLEHVGRPARGGSGTIAVLAHRRAGTGHDERGDRRHVDRVSCDRRPCRRCRRHRGPAGNGTGSENASSVASRPVISSTVSPFMRRPIMNAAICAGDAAPSRISVSAAPACADGEVAPRRQRPQHRPPTPPSPRASPRFFPTERAGATTVTAPGSSSSSEGGGMEGGGAEVGPGGVGWGWPPGTSFGAADNSSREPTQSHQRSRSSTPRAMSPSCTCDVPSTMVSCFASR